MTTQAKSRSTEFNQQVAEVFSSRYRALACKTDRLFGYLFVFQWVLGVVFAATLSPSTWVGEYSQAHIHLYASVFLGGLLALLPIYLIFKNPGATLNRMVVAVSQILFSILFIHLTGGRIETHFHIFGSLAFLAFYRDWRPVLIGTVVTTLDHLVRGAFWPESVYGVLSASPFRAFEHAAWVLFEDFILLNSIKLALGELRSVSENQVELLALNQNLEHRVTERTRELASKNKELAESHQLIVNTSKMSALGEMAGGVAHEINNPLASIKNLLSQIQEVVDDDPIDKNMLKRMALTAETTTNRIAKIILGLRSFSRDGGKDPFEPVDVQQLIDETLSFCGERFRNQGIKLDVIAFPKDLSFEGRATQISQVLLNLLNNAYDAILSQKDKWVRVSVADLDKEIEIKVTDCGSGIPLATQKSIFQPFFTTKEIGKGTGLGLSISSGIVQSHHGALSLDHQCPNTCFVIRLPKIQAKITATAA